MIGHSIGEYVAACLAGVFTLQDALALVAGRGRLIQTLPGGAMLAVPLSEAETRRYIRAGLSIAAVNGPSACVVSGEREAIDALGKHLSEANIPSRRLHTSHAFHSAAMDPILPPFLDLLRKVNLKPPGIRYISNVTGTWVTPEQATDPLYWVEQLTQDGALFGRDFRTDQGREPDPPGGRTRADTGHFGSTVRESAIPCTSPFLLAQPQGSGVGRRVHSENGRTTVGRGSEYRLGRVLPERASSPCFVTHLPA